MRKKQKKMLAGLLTAAGAVSGFFGLRALVNWMKQRAYEREHSMQGMAAAIPSTGMPERNYPQTGMQHTYTGEVVLPETGVAEGGVISTSVDEVDEMARARRERETDEIPTTGMLGQDVMDMQRTREYPREYPREDARDDAQEARTREDRTREKYYTGAGDRDMTTQVGTDGPVAVGSLVGPLVVHLLSFHNMIDMLRRRRETRETTGSDPNIPDVRAGGADAIDSLEAQLPEFDRAALVRGSLQERIVEVMERIRDTLKNSEYDEERLFKIHDEMRSSICKVLDLIHKDEEDNVTGFEDVKEAYRCR